MSEYLKAPSSFKGTTNVADIASKCRMLLKASSSIVRFRFLSKDDPYEKMLLRYCRKQSKAELRRKIILKMDLAALRAVEQGNLLTALERLLPVDTIAIEAIASHSKTLHSSLGWAAMLDTLAKAFWIATYSRTASATLRGRYLHFHEVFPDLLKAFEEFMATPEIKAWRGSSPSALARIKKPCLLSDWQTYPAAIDLLLQRDFSGIIHLTDNDMSHETCKTRDETAYKELLSILQDNFLAMGMGLHYPLTLIGDKCATNSSKRPQQSACPVILIDLMDNPSHPSIMLDYSHFKTEKLPPSSYALDAIPVEPASCIYRVPCLSPRLPKLENGSI